MKIWTINPATEEKIKSYRQFTLKELNSTIEKSQIAFKKFKDIPVRDRAYAIKKVSKDLLKNKKALSKIITEEMGKPINESSAEIEKCAWLCDYFAKNAEKFLEEEKIKTEHKKSYIRFDPLGKILCIMPWNFPFWQVMRFAVPALCAGNSVILKHSSITLGCSLEAEKIFNENFDKNIFQTVITDGNGVKSLIPKVNGVSLTGSVETGRKIGKLAGENIKKHVLELGGSDPFIVLKDADLDLSCTNAVKGRILNSGQSCIAAKRFIVVKERFNEFSEKIIKLVSELEIGNPMNSRTNVGPLARKNFVVQLDKQVKKSVKEGAKILYQKNEKFERGFYFNPIIIQGNNKVTIAKEETFGPVFTLIKVDNDKEAIREANNTSLGLGASIWTKDISKAERYAKEIESGFVSVNDIVKSDPRLPFGGVKDSGIGRELSRYGMLEFCNIKSIVVK